MKKIITFLLLFGSVSAFAQGHGYHHGYHGHHHHSYNWVSPLIVGGVIGYALNRPQTVYVQPTPYVTTIPTIQVQNCTPWIEVQNPDGTISRTRTCSP